MKKLLFLSWRDIKNPKNGGAENFTHELMKRLVKKGYEVFHFACGFSDSPSSEIIEGVHYHRGSQNTIKIVQEARSFYKKNGPFFWVIDQRNTHHFFTNYWLPKSQPRALFIHQTTRELWHIEMKKPLSLMGHSHEILTLKNQNWYPTFTASYSTAEELIHDFGFQKNRVFPFHQGLNKPCPDLKSLPKKFEEPSFIYVGRFSKYKGIEDTLWAFKQFHETFKKGKLFIVGKKNKEFDSKIWKPFLKKNSLLENHIVLTGFVSEAKRDELMAKSHAILVPSPREGWGIIVTEAAAQNTTAIVYPSPGLMEAVDFGRTGLITQEKNWEALAEQMEVLWQDEQLRNNLTQKARKWAESFNWDIAANQCEDFLNNEDLLRIFK